MDSEFGSEEDCLLDPLIPRHPGEPCVEYRRRVDAMNSARVAAGIPVAPAVGLPVAFPGAASPRLLSLAGARPRTWNGLPPPVAVPAIPADGPEFDPTLRTPASMPFPPAGSVGIGPLPVGVPSAWSPLEPVAPPFVGPSGAVGPGLREPFGSVGPVPFRDAAFGATGFDRRWGTPPPMGGMYAGLVWSPERLLFEPGASMPSEHWYRKLTQEGVYVQAYQDDESEAGVWKYRYVRSPKGYPVLGRPYEVLGALTDLYREKEIRDLEAATRAAEERIRLFKKFDNSLLSRVQRGEVVEEAEFVLPEKFKRMEKKREPTLLPMPFWTAVSKASVEKMYRDAGLPVPEMPGEAAVNNDKAFQTFKEDRGHDGKSSPFFIPAEEQWDAAEKARRQRLKEQREQTEEAARDRVESQYAPVPNVSGMTEEDAESAIRNAGFEFNAVGNTTGVARAKSQRPAAGNDARKGSAVEVRFLGEGDAGLPPPPRGPGTGAAAPSSGASGTSGSADGPQQGSPGGGRPSRVSVPAIRGLNWDLAYAKVIKSGLWFDTADMSAGEAQEDGRYVVNQSPAANTEVAPGSPVKAYFKTAKDYPEAPNVLNWLGSRAEAYLIEHGFSYRSDKGSPGPYDRVISQYPRPGQPVMSKSLTIQLTYGEGSDAGPVPGAWR